MAYRMAMPIYTQPTTRSQSVTLSSDVTLEIQNIPFHSVCASSSSQAVSTTAWRRRSEGACLRRRQGGGQQRQKLLLAESRQAIHFLVRASMAAMASLAIGP